MIKVKGYINDRWKDITLSKVNQFPDGQQFIPNTGMLKPVFKNGVVLNEEDFDEIRKRIKNARTPS